MRTSKLSVLILLAFAFIFQSCRKDDKEANEQFFYLRNKGADMPVWVEGNLSSNIFVIMVHGGPGGTSTVYNTFLTSFSEPMEKKYAMVYWDQRGSGVSGGKYNNDRLHIDQYIDDLDKLIALLKHRYNKDIQVYLLGHSWGGTLTAAYLSDQNRQSNVKGWIEVDGAHYFDASKETHAALLELSEDISSRNLEEVQRNFWNDLLRFCRDLNVDQMSDMDKVTLNNYGHQVEEKLVELNILNTPEIDPKALLNYAFTSEYNPITETLNSIMTASQLGMFDHLMTLDYRPQLPDITIPTFFMWGKYDMVVPVSVGIEGYELSGASYKELIIFEQSGHSPMINETTLFVSELIRFIENTR